MKQDREITSVRAITVGAGWRNYIFVLIETNMGVTGLGEASLGGQTNAVIGALKDLEPLLLGADPFRIEHIWQQAFRHAFWRGGVTFLSALAGVEVALWDIKGKVLGVPVHTLLGGLVRHRVRAYANGPRGDSPEALANSALELTGRGFTGLKFAPFDATPILAGGHVVAEAVARVAAVRDAVGPDIDLMIDAHGRLSPAMARRVAEALAPYGIMFLEEPSLPEHIPSITRVARRSPVPIAVGERHYTRWDFRELLASRTVNVVQPDIIQSGGIAEARKIAAFAEMHFVSVAPHNPWSWVNTAASLHLDAVTPNFLIQEVVTDPEPWKDAIVKNPPAIDREGYFAVPTEPGIGIELDVDAAAHFPPVQGRPPALWQSDGSVADW